MNIIKNKNFKNHKKILLLGAFVVCQIFAISFQSSNRVNMSFNRVSASPAPTPTIDYNDARRKVKRIVENINNNMLASLYYIRSINQKKIAGLSYRIASEDEYIKGCITKNNVPVNNNVPAIPNDWYKDAGPNSPSNIYSLFRQISPDDAKESIVRSTLGFSTLEFLTVQLVDILKGLVDDDSRLSNIVANNGAIQILLNMGKFIENLDSKKQLNNLFGRFSLYSILLTFSFNFMKALGPEFDLVGELLRRCSFLSEAMQVSSKALGKLPNKNYDVVRASIFNPLKLMADVNSGANLGQSIHKLIGMVLTPQLMEKFSLNQNYKNTSEFLSKLEKDRLGDVISDKGHEGLKLVYSSSYVNAIPNFVDKGLKSISDLYYFGVNRSFYSFAQRGLLAKLNEGQLRATVQAPGYNVRVPRVSVVKKGGTNTVIDFKGNVPGYYYDYDGNNNNINMQTAEADKCWPGPIIDFCAERLLSRCFLSTCNLNIGGTSNSVDDYFEFINKISKSNSDNLTALSYDPAYHAFFVWTLGASNNLLPQQGQRNWFPVTFMYNLSEAEGAIRDKLGLEMSYVIDNTQTAGSLNDDKTSWGIQSRETNRYITGKLTELIDVINNFKNILEVRQPGGGKENYTPPIKNTKTSFGDLNRPITAREFWSTEHTDEDRNALRNSSDAGVKARFSCKIYTTKKFSGVDFDKFNIDPFYMTPEEYGKLTDGVKNVLVEATKDCPIYGNLFKCPPFSGSEKESGLEDIDIRQIAFEGYSNGSSKTWDGLNSKLKDILRKRNKFLNYPPFTSLSSMTDSAKDDIVTINLLPSTYRDQVKEYIEKHKKYERKRYDWDDWGYGPRRYRDDDDDSGFSNRGYVRLGDIALNYGISNNTDELAKIEPEVLKKFFEMLIKGEFDSKIKPASSTDYTYDTYTGRKIFKFFAAISSFATLKSIQKYRTGDRFDDTVKEIYDIILKAVNDQMTRYRDGFNDSDYRNQMTKMLNALQEGRDYGKEVPYQDILEGFGALFGIPPKLTYALFGRNSEILQDDVKRINGLIVYSESVIKGFWQEVVDMASIRPGENAVLKAVDLPDDASRDEEKNLLSKFVYLFGQAHMSTMKKMEQLIIYGMERNAKDKNVKTYISDIGLENKTPITSLTDLKNKVSVVSKFYKDAIKDNNVFSSASGYENYSWDRSDSSRDVLSGCRDIVKKIKETFVSLNRDIGRYNSDVLRNDFGSRRDGFFGRESEASRALSSARNNYSSNQAALLQDILATAYKLATYFKTSVWGNLQTETLAPITEAVKSIVKVIQGITDFSSFESDLKNGRLPMPKVDNRYAWEDYNDSSVADNKDKDNSNPYAIISGLLKAQEESYNKLSDAAKNTMASHGQGNFKAAPYMRLIMDYIGSMYVLHYVNNVILKDSMVISTFNIDENKSDTKSLKDMGFSESKPGDKSEYKSPIEFVIDNVSVLLREYDGLSSENRFIVNRDSLNSVKDSLTKLKSVDSAKYFDGPNSAYDAAVQEAAAKEEEEKEKKEDEEALKKQAEEEENKKKDENDEKDDDDAEEDDDDREQEPVRENVVPQQTNPAVVAPAVVEHTAPITIRSKIMDKNRAKYVPGYGQATVDPITGAITGKLVYQGEQACHRTTKNGAPIRLFAVVFENGRKLMENGASKKIFLERVGNSEQEFTFSYTPKDPQALIEFHFYDDSNEADRLAGVIAEHENLFHGTLQFGSWSLNRTNKTDVALNTAGRFLTGNDQPVTDPAVLGIKFVKRQKQNGDYDLVLEMTNLPGDPSNLICCPVPIDGAHRCEMNFQPVALEGLNRWIIQIPKIEAENIGQLHFYEGIEEAKSFKFKVVNIDLNSVAQPAAQKQVSAVQQQQPQILAPAVQQPQILAPAVQQLPQSDQQMAPAATRSRKVKSKSADKKTKGRDKTKKNREVNERENDKKSPSVVNNEDVGDTSSDNEPVLIEDRGNDNVGEEIGDEILGQE